VDRCIEKDLRKGKQQAFAHLFELYADKLLRLGYTLLFNQTDTEDVVQDALIGFVDALRDGNFRGGNGAVEAYLRRSVRNQCIDRLRRSGRLPTSQIANADSMLEAQHQPVLPSKILDEKRMQALIETAIQNLPDAQRAVIVLRLLEDYSYQQIADELSISLDYVKNLMARARQRLRQELEPFVEGK
jgi:RNA polymerase sigma-70 factor, ECF subfamily